METNLFEDAIQLIKEENKPAAREILVELIDANPYDELAWWWFAQAHYTKKQQTVILHKGLAANPESELLANTLKKLDSQGKRVYEQPNTASIPQPGQNINLPMERESGEPAPAPSPPSKPAPSPQPQSRPTPDPIGDLNFDELPVRKGRVEEPFPISIPSSAEATTLSKKKDPEFFNSLRFQDPYAAQRQRQPQPQAAPEPPTQSAPKKNQLPLYIMGGLTGLVLIVQLVFFFTSLLRDNGPTPEQGAAYQDTVAAQQVVGLQESFETTQPATTLTPQTAPSQPDLDIINASAADSAGSAEAGAQPAATASADAAPTEIVPALAVPGGSQPATEAAQSPTEAAQSPTAEEAQTAPTEAAAQTPETGNGPEMGDGTAGSMAGKLQDLNLTKTLRLPHSLYFLSTIGGKSQIFQMDAYGSHLVQITNEPQGVDDFDVSPNSSDIVYITANRLVLLEGNYRNKTILFEGDVLPADLTDTFRWTQLVSDPVWSNNGRFIAFSHNGIKIIELTTKEVQHIVTNAPPPAGETSPLRLYTPLAFTRENNHLLLQVIYEKGEILAAYKINAEQLIFVNLDACCNFSYAIDNTHIYLTDAVDENYNHGVWHVNPLLGNMENIAPEGEGGSYTWPKQSPFGRLYYFYAAEEEQVYGLYSSHTVELEKKTPLLEGKYVLGEALWSNDAYLVVIQDKTSHTIKILRTDSNPVIELPFNGDHFQWGRTQDIDLSFFEKKSTAGTQVEINIEDPIKTEEITIEEPKMNMVTDLNPDQQLFEEYKGLVYPPYPEDLELVSFTQVNSQFNISILHDEERIMVWLGEALSRYGNNHQLSIIRDIVAVPDDLDQAGFSLGKCTVDGLVDPNVFAIGSWYGSFELAHIEYALWIDEINKQLFPIYRENIKCVMDLLIQQKNGYFNIWNNYK